MFVTWSDEKYSLGISEIDSQHRELFLLTNQLFECSRSPERRKELNGIFKRLYAYTKYHFSSEQAVFKQFGYPGIIGHCEIHANFARAIKEKIDWYRDNPARPLDELLDFLVAWIVNHINGEDRKYAAFFRKNKIPVSVHFSVNGSGAKSSVNAEARRIWEENRLSMDIAGIDGEHKELVHILQQFNDLQKGRDDRKETFIPVFIQKLAAYAEYHFSHEEELMSMYGYSETLEHRELHKGFILRVQDFEREAELHKETLLDEIILFLKDWTINHILKEDAKYKNLLLDRTGKESAPS